MSSEFSSKYQRLKGLKYLWSQDKDRLLLRYFFSHPLKYAKNYLLSLWKKQPFTQEGNLYFFGIEKIEHWKKKISSPRSKILIGLPYCIKPTHCPQKKFSIHCSPDSSAICSSCIVGKYQKTFSQTAYEIFIIPTLFDIAQKIILMRKQYPDQEIVFIIAACKSTIVLFADLAHMLQLSGIAIALSGDVCSSFSAFIAAEHGKKRKTPFILENLMDLLSA